MGRLARPGSPQSCAAVVDALVAASQLAHRRKHPGCRQGAHGPKSQVETGICPLPGDLAQGSSLGRCSPGSTGSFRIESPLHSRRISLGQDRIKDRWTPRRKRRDSHSERRQPACPRWSLAAARCRFGCLAWGTDRSSAFPRARHMAVSVFQGSVACPGYSFANRARGNKQL